MGSAVERRDSLDGFHPCSRAWFERAFAQPTKIQERAWPVLSNGQSALLVAPTGSGKTLSAFFSALDRLLFAPPPVKPGVRVLYVSPLKALAYDVERNLRGPLTGLAAEALRQEEDSFPVRVNVRNGDTPAAERERMRKNPPDILITTPESLYLMLGSRAHEMFFNVETVIVDEIHALVEGKRGSHLFLSLERIEELRQEARDGQENGPAAQPAPLQRIGLSATQRPLEEVARLLGGFTIEREALIQRPVTIVDAGETKRMELSVEVPTADMRDFSDATEWDSSGTTREDGAPRAGMTKEGSAHSIWPAIVPRLVEHIQAHRSTLVFVNSRGSAERLAGAINEVAGKELARAHHGSLAHEARADVEEMLKEGRLPAIVATASLELGIDMGAIELVIQVESPPSIASGLQRVGRARHQVGGVPRGITFPKYRSDLVACAASVKAMLQGRIESTKYPRNPIDVLAQQVVAMVARRPTTVDALYDRVRGAAPFSDLSRASFEGVLDMLSGRYPSEDFADLRARLTWDRMTGELTARKGAGRVALINGGTIPDRGLYGVFLAGAEQNRPVRVGELDEEMVFESRVGDVFLLGASSWRVEEITHDRVLVTPAPGEPGRMPFWHGDGPGRPLEFGREIGRFVRQVAQLSKERAQNMLRTEHFLNDHAAHNLLSYLKEQEEQSALPSDRQIVIERFVDEIGDHRVCVLSPLGGRVHAPWAMAVRATLVDRLGLEIDLTWSDDGIVFRLAEGDTVPPLLDFIPRVDDASDRVVARLAETSLFAAHFRENAGRALLLPKRRPGGRTPLWALRRRSATLLSVAARFRDFPIVLETYRQCLQDHFDLPGLHQVLQEVASRKIRVVTRETSGPSPFAAALMWNFVEKFMYEADAPLAERRAQALTIDSARLRELMGEEALRELLDAEVIAELEDQLQKKERRLGSPDEVHDLLLSLGPLTKGELLLRHETEEKLTQHLTLLLNSTRIVEVSLANTPLISAVEDAARLRDGLGLVVGSNLPSAFLEAVPDPLGDLVLRHARTHGPFSADQIAQRFELGISVVVAVLQRLQKSGRLEQGQFLPGGDGTEWCEVEVLRRIKRLCLQKLRGQISAVPQEALARFALRWHELEPTQISPELTSLPSPPRTRSGSFGPDALLPVLERLEGIPISAKTLESEILPARLREYSSAHLDELCAAGEIVWQGVRASHPGDGRIALYLASHFPLLARPGSPVEGELQDQIVAALSNRGGLFFRDLSSLIGGFPQELLDALWDLIWAGHVSNDTLTPLRRLGAKNETRAERRRRGRFARPARSTGLSGSEGRFWLIDQLRDRRSDDLEHRTRWTQKLLLRHGIVTREVMAQEELEGGFGAVYPLLKALEERGQVRRGYFVEGLGATQFAERGAENLLRDQAEPTELPEVLCLAATDPANLYGTVLPWPAAMNRRAERAPGARVLLDRGRLIGFLSRSQKHLTTNLSEDLAERAQQVNSLAACLSTLVQEPRRQLLQLETIDGEPARNFPELSTWERWGYRRTASGLLLRQDGLGQDPVQPARSNRV